MTRVTLESFSSSARAPARVVNITASTLFARPGGPVRSRTAECWSTRRPNVPQIVSHGKRTPRRQVAVWAGYHEAYPFEFDNYYRVFLHIVASPTEIQTQGVAQGQLILMRQELSGLPPDTDQRGLTLGVSGDTLLAVTYQAQNLPMSRPLTLDLLWQVLQRGMETQRGQWQLLHVAIVEIRGFCYIGRAFFGNRETGEVAWDCDCRPSDAVWLAQKTHAPIFVRKTVWNEHAASLTDMTQQEFKRHLQSKNLQREAQTTLKATRSMLERHMDSSSHAHTLIRYDDPEPVKRLKRELGVAVIEQDFAQAARIRDHPFMKLHREILKQRELGNQEKTTQLQMELEQAINDSLRPSQSHSV